MFVIRSSKITSFRNGWVSDLLAGVAAYYLTSLLVFVGVLFGAWFLYPARGSRSIAAADPGAFVVAADPIAACAHFDAQNYQDIIQHGYSYNPAQASLVAFFPLIR